MMNRRDHRQLVHRARRILARAGVAERVQRAMEALRTSGFAERFDAERKIREAVSPMTSLEEVRGAVARALTRLGCDLRDVLITLAWKPAEGGRPGMLAIEAGASVEAAAAAVSEVRARREHRASVPGAA